MNSFCSVIVYFFIIDDNLKSINTHSLCLRRGVVISVLRAHTATATALAPPVPNPGYAPVYPEPSCVDTRS